MPREWPQKWQKDKKKEKEIKTNEVGTGVDNNTNEFDTFPKEIPVLALIETSTSDYEEKEMLTSWGDITIIITPITAFETHTLSHHWAPLIPRPSSQGATRPRQKRWVLGHGESNLSPTDGL